MSQCIISSPRQGESIQCIISLPDKGAVTDCQDAQTYWESEDCPVRERYSWTLSGHALARQTLCAFPPLESMASVTWSKYMLFKKAACPCDSLMTTSVDCFIYQNARCFPDRHTWPEREREGSNKHFVALHLLGASKRHGITALSLN